MARSSQWKPAGEFPRCTPQPRKTGRSPVLTHGCRGLLPAIFRDAHFFDGKGAETDKKRLTSIAGRCRGQYAAAQDWTPARRNTHSGAGMRRVLSFLIAGLIVLMAARVQAASPPLELSVVSAGRAGSSAADNLLQANLMGVIRGVLHRLPVAPASFRLTLGEATVPITLPNFMVGQGALRSLAIDTSQGWQTRPSFELREQWDFLAAKPPARAPLNASCGCSMLKKPIGRGRPRRRCACWRAVAP